MKAKIIGLLLVLFPIVALASSRAHTLSVGTFTKIEVVNNIRVDIKCVPDSAGQVVFKATDHEASGLIFDCRNQKLKIMISPDFIGEIDSMPSLTVYADMIEEVINNGEKSVRLNKPARVPSLNLIQIGNGSIEASDLNQPRITATIATGKGVISLEGACQEAVFRLTGAGDLRAQNLECDLVTCQILGAGNIYCWPKEKLSVKGLGSTRIYYRGNPAKIKKSGMGKLIKME